MSQLIIWLVLKQSREHLTHLGNGRKGIAVLFLKVDIDAQELQLPNGLQQRDRIAGKPGNGLGDDQVHLNVVFDTK